MAASTSTASAQQSPPPSSPPPPPPVTESTDESTAKVVHKRYEGLVMVRTKAIKGKGAWYWAHLEPILAHNPDTGLPKAVKLRCSLCGAVFSASNPSRTASEHLKRGTCPNFSSDSTAKPISAISPTGMMNLSSPTSSNHRKRNSGNRNRTNNLPTTYSVAPITMIEPARFSIDGSYPTRPESMPALPPASSGLYSPHQQQYHQQQRMQCTLKEEETIGYRKPPLLPNLKQAKTGFESIPTVNTSNGISTVTDGMITQGEERRVRVQQDRSSAFIRFRFGSRFGPVPRIGSDRFPVPNFSINHVPGPGPIGTSRFPVPVRFRVGYRFRPVPRSICSSLVLSGGKEDLGALAMFEDSVKKLKSPKTPPGQTLTKSQIDSSLGLLTDWVYENCGSVSFSSLNHPKFKTFLNQLGLPVINRRELAGERLDSKYLNAKSESEARIRDAMFFQISSDGWKSKPGEKLVNISVNLPNGTSVFRRAVFTTGYVFSKYAEDVLMETIIEICGNNLPQCVGIVSDKFKSKALKNLENQHQWMINLSCQSQGVINLIKDFNKELPLFKNVTDNCFKLANFVNTTSQIRNSFLKYQFQESGRARLIRVPFTTEFEFEPVFNMVEDILTSARTLHLLLLDDSYQKLLIEDQIAREIEETIRNPQFWREIEAVHSLVNLIKSMANEISKERPRIGQCLPLWEELRVKLKDWCLKYQMNETHVDKVFDKRFKRNYHPAWAAAFILDPFYLIRDRTGKYLPPFKCLTPDQEKDVDKLITRLVSQQEAHIALMELMKWRTEGLDPVYAQAVQLKQRDPVTGKMKIANPQSSRLVWETYLTEFNSLRKVAVRLIFLHATSCGFKWNRSFLKWAAQSRSGMEKAQKLIFIAAHSRVERRDFSNDDEKDAEFFAVANGDDDMINEVLFDGSSP